MGGKIDWNALNTVAEYLRDDDMEMLIDGLLVMSSEANKE